MGGPVFCAGLLTVLVPRLHDSAPQTGGVALTQLGLTASPSGGQKLEVRVSTGVASAEATSPPRVFTRLSLGMCLSVS